MTQVKQTKAQVLQAELDLVKEEVELIYERADIIRARLNAYNDESPVGQNVNNSLKALMDELFA